jgi:hypothetical protein
MAADERMNLDFILQFLDVLERHGYHYHDDLHTDRAVGLLRDVARIYEGPQDHPSGPSGSQAPSPSTSPGPPGPEPEPGPSVPEDDLDAVTLTHAEVRTVLTSLDLAADWKRDRAGMCADCPDQSCLVCQLRLQEARTYDQLAVQLLHDEQATRDARSQPGPVSSPRPAIQPRPAAEREAGQ